MKQDQQQVFVPLAVVTRKVSLAVSQQYLLYLIGLDEH